MSASVIGWGARMAPRSPCGPGFSTGPSKLEGKRAWYWMDEHIKVAGSTADFRGDLISVCWGFGFEGWG